MPVLAFLGSKGFLTATAIGLLVLSFVYLFVSRDHYRSELLAAEQRMAIQERRLEEVDRIFDELAQVTANLTERANQTDAFIRREILANDAQRDGDISPVLGDTIEFLRSRNPHSSNSGRLTP